MDSCAFPASKFLITNFLDYLKHARRLSEGNYLGQKEGFAFAHESQSGLSVAPFYRGVFFIERLYLRTEVLRSENAIPFVSVTEHLHIGLSLYGREEKMGIF
jgi:hypothetical protein